MASDAQLPNRALILNILDQTVARITARVNANPPKTGAQIENLQLREAEAKIFDNLTQNNNATCTQLTNFNIKEFTRIYGICQPSYIRMNTRAPNQK